MIGGKIIFRKNRKPKTANPICQIFRDGGIDQPVHKHAVLQAHRDNQNDENAERDNFKRKLFHLEWGMIMYDQ